MYKIEKVYPDVVCPLRHKVLRLNLSFEAACLPFDNDFGAMDYLKKEIDVETLWCNARVTAFEFYEKIGFTILGKVFDIPNLSLHKTGFIKL